MPNEKRLPRSTPEAQGVSSSAIYNFVEAVEEQISDLHSFLFLRHGAVVAEGGWSPYNPTYPHILYSLSKSFTSTAIGMAVAEGRLTVEDRVLSFFPDEAPPQASEKLAAMQVRHLLSMVTGHAEDTTGYMRDRPDGHWIEAFLAQPVVYEPGTHFLYNTGATYMLSAIIQKLTGMTLLDYLQPRLFEPLGIKNPTWEMSPKGICTGGWGLVITTQDIARFGQLYLQKGQWEGKQLVSEAWVEEATIFQVDNSPNDSENPLVGPDWTQGYGYQFWRCQHNIYRGDGAFGQYCIVMPDQDAVLAITSGLDDMQAVLTLVWQHLLPAMSETAPLPEQEQVYERLSHKLNNLAYLPPQGQKTSAIAAQVSGKTFVITTDQVAGTMFVTESNTLGVTALSFDFSPTDVSLTIHTKQGERQLIGGIGAWREGECDLFSNSPRVATSGVWQDENTFVMALRFFETPYVHTISCRFDGNQLVLEGSLNVSFEATTYSLVGQLQS